MRTIPLNSSGLKVLGAWSLNRKNDLVFYNHETSEKLVGLKAGFSLACKKAGISDVSWHTLRHTFASRLLDRGVDIVTVQQLLGHFDSHRNHALYAHKSRVEESRGSKLASVRGQFGDSCTKMQQRKCSIVTNGRLTHRLRYN